MASNHQLRPPLVEWFAARPVGLLVGFTVTGWLAAMLWPNLLRTLGILGYGNTQFLDSYAVLAAVDAVRAGANPHGPNALDPLMRGHVYSDWWLALRWLGLTRAQFFGRTYLDYRLCLDGVGDRPPSPNLRDILVSGFAAFAAFFPSRRARK